VTVRIRFNANSGHFAMRSEHPAISAYLRPYFGFASARILATSLSVTFGRLCFALSAMGVA
jgi:hypothetical protein